MPAPDGTRGRVVDEELGLADLLSAVEDLTFGGLREDIVATVQIHGQVAMFVVAVSSRLGCSELLSRFSHDALRSRVKRGMFKRGTSPQPRRDRTHYRMTMRIFCSRSRECEADFSPGHLLGVIDVDCL